MPTVYLAPDPINSTQLIPGGVIPASGGKLFQYLAGSSTKTDTYTDITGTVKWSNPIVLDSGGNLGGSNEVWIPAGVTVKFVLAPFNDTDPPIAPYKTWDNLSGINDPTSLLTEWVVGPTPTFVSTTSFTLVGDQTAIFTPGRRVKTTNTAGTRYGTISASVFGAVTTVTIVNDSGTLDAGLSAVWYALINPVNTSLPLIVSVLNFGAKGDGVTDDTAAIQAWIVAISAIGKLGYVPAGTYILTKGASQADEAGTTFPCLTMASNLHIWAEPGAVFKLADGQSTDGAPINLAMFFSNAVLSNISIRNLTVDMNGANNKISPNRGTGVFTHKTFAHILFSGTPAGIAASGTDILIDNCIFKNTPGVTCIGMAQSNTASVTLGNRWTVRNCLFNNNGTDDNDHTSIYAWADDVLIEGNTFTNDAMTGVDGGVGTGVGPNAAIEPHGANQRLIGNKVKNYYLGFWIGNNYTSAVENVIITGNDIGPVKALGIDSYRAKPGAASPQAVKKIQITNNSIQLSDDTTTLALKVAVQIPATEQAITDWLISNNRAEKTGTTIGSAFVNLAAATTAANKHDNITISNNIARGFSRGIVLTTNATNGLGIVEVSNNALVDCKAAGAFNAVGLIFDPSVAPPIDELRIRGNSFLDTAGAPSMLYGIYLGSGVITRFYLGGNVYLGATTANYTEVSVTITNREGESTITNTQTGATYTVLPNDTEIIANRAGTVTLTLEPVLTAPNKRLLVRTIQAQTVVSASSNVVPLVGGAAGTAILAATAGKWALLHSDGTNWQIMAGN